MKPEEKARQQINIILSRYGWTIQDKSQMKLHATESTASPTNLARRIAAKVERRLSAGRHCQPWWPSTSSALAAHAPS
jgi:hypothetical protein